MCCTPSLFRLASKRCFVEAKSAPHSTTSRARKQNRCALELVAARLVPYANLTLMPSAWRSIAVAWRPGYLCTMWKRLRPALDRAGIGRYGFRIAEPNHDGTPHWHLLIFLAPDKLEKLKDIVLKHALREAPDEPGAHSHRVDFKPIEAGKGTAAGYIAKYVAKNIDGHKLDADLYGNPAAETAERVEAWATTWAIRQFQQIGGPPVTVWRELRRIKAIPEGAPDNLKQAHRAANKLQKIEGRENASVAWDRYCRAQGGVFCGRKYPIRMATATKPGIGRYGEPLGERPIGVQTTCVELWTPPHMAHMGGVSERTVLWVCESERHQWTIGKKMDSNNEKTKRSAGVLMGDCDAGVKQVWTEEVIAEELRRADADARKVAGIWPLAPEAPWTRVNNCTEPAAQSAETTAPKQIDVPIDQDGRCVEEVYQPLMELRYPVMAGAAPH